MGDYNVSSRSAPNAVTVSLERQREAEGDMIQIHRGGDSVNVEAEIRVIQARNASNVLFSRRSWRGKQQILL